MFRIDTPNASQTLPSPAPVGTQGYFQDSDPAGGTVVSADWLNSVQEEIARFIESKGITLDKQDMDQLKKAMDRTIATRGAWANLEIESQHTVVAAGNTSVEVDNCSHIAILASHQLNVQNRQGQVLGGTDAVKWVLSSTAGYIGIRGVKLDPEYVAMYEASSITIPAGGSVTYNVNCKRVASETPIGGIPLLSFGYGSDEPTMLCPFAWPTDVGTDLYFSVVIRNHGNLDWHGTIYINVIPIYKGTL